jgi:hypothetical protein
MRAFKRADWIIIAAASGLFIVPGQARAAEAFLCGPDTVVYVEVHELEHKKKTDPCIAGYFGLTVGDAADASATLPVTTPSANADLRILSDAQDGTAKSALNVNRHALNASKPPVAAANTDFRNVLVLNAESKEQAWYRHMR